MVTKGHATLDGTARYLRRFEGTAAPGHFRPEQDLWFSSLGIGTYLGNADEATDKRYSECVVTAIRSGVNVIDTAANYRFQRGERSIGSALRQIVDGNPFSRDEIIVCTKGGYIPFDGEAPVDRRKYIQETFEERGVASPSDFVGGSHCMTPPYLQSQINQSLENMGLDCIDVYYLHNPESQLSEIDEDEFRNRIRSAFRLFESNIREGKIRHYGVATWNGFRLPPTERGYHPLKTMMDLAREAGGETNGFHFIQVPFNLAMPEALTFRNQQVGDKWLSVIESAREWGLTVVASASMLQGKVARGLSDEVIKRLGSLPTQAQTAIQFVRSTPGITTALVGMSRVEHVRENLHLVSFPPPSIEDYQKLYA